MTKLALRHCTPVKKGSKPISPGIARSLLNQVNNKWRLDTQAKSVEREFEFADFRQTIEFVNAVSWIANNQDHHPNLEINYNRCKVRFSTHTAGGLTVNDFICAAKVDALFNEERLRKISASAVKRQHPPSPAGTDESSSLEVRETATEDNIQLNQLSLDNEEVEELLSKRQVDEEDESTTQDTTDEFELIDPETVKPPEPPQEAASQKEQQQKSPAVTKDQPAIIEDFHAELDLTSTVILPPGMQVVGKKSPDEEDEDATVILPENTALDPEKAATAKSESAVNPLPAPALHIEDDDEVKTVILSPTLAPKTEEETVILPPESPEHATLPTHTKPPSPGGSVSLPPIHPHADEDEVGTMILSSNPFNHPDSTGRHGTHQSGDTSGQGNKNQETTPEASAKNKSGEKPPANTTSKPAVVEAETDYMGTMVMTPAEMEAMRLEQSRKKPTAAKKVDEDDTLVMHVNDFKKIKNDQQ